MSPRGRPIHLRRRIVGVKSRKSFLSVLASLTRLFSIILVTAALSLAVLLIVQSVYMPFHVVLSNSMSPQISKGDAVLIKEVEPQTIKAGQVIVFRDPGKKDDFIVHRVVGVETSGAATLFTTKGDNNPVQDDWKISTGEVIGSVAVNVPHFGSLLDFLSTARGFVACVAIPAGVAIALVILLGVGETAEERRYRVKMRRPVPTGKRFDPKPTASS